MGSEQNVVRVHSGDGTTLLVTIRGSHSAPTVVLVHGLGLSARSWEPVAARLAERYHVVTYDLRGHGASAMAATGDYGMTAQAADLDAVLAATVEPQHRAVVVGHSLGGEIILARARRSLDGIAGAVFTGSAGSVVTMPGLPGHRLPGPLQRIVRRFWLLVLHAAARTASSLRDVTPLTDLVGRLLVFAPGDSTEAVRTARADFLATDPGVLARTTLASVSDDGSQLAPSLRVPTLILRGDHDKEASAADTRLLLSRLPDGHLITIPGAGHMLPLTESDIVAHHIRDWVTRIHRPTPSTDPSDLPT
jgi:pimeloyl-ACP methyl ester carboxylesterase